MDYLHLEKLVKSNSEMYVFMNIALFLGNFLRISEDFSVKVCKYFVVLGNCGDISFLNNSGCPNSFMCFFSTFLTILGPVYRTGM